MSAAISSENPALPTANPSRGTGRPRRARRGGRHLPTRSTPHPNTPQATEAIEAFAPPNHPSHTPQQAQPSHVRSSAQSSGQQTRGNRSERGGNSGRRGRGNRHNIGSQRVFGGQLSTNDSNQNSAVPTALNAGAQEFTPGKPVPESLVRGNNRARRLSKSSAPDIATRTHEGIDNGLYECPICTNEIRRNSRVWSCKTCWTVFHLSCVKKWSLNEGSAQERQRNESGELPARQWRCPGCNLPKDELPTSYNCWCGKEIDPKPITGLPPHSCGQTCSKTRAPRKCPHPCELICHAGPCPPCPHMGPSLSCYCGKNISSKRCVDTNYDDGWSCGEICSDPLPCGEHNCPRPCHEGLCGDCDVMVEARCYCGKTEKLIRCSERGDSEESRALRPSEGQDLEAEAFEEIWTGTFDCGKLCERPFDCNKHSCKKTCHTFSTALPPHCPLSPDTVTHCPCGKTDLTELGCLRTSCEDAIPHCEKPCQRALPCGHFCQQKCHSGECRPCLQSVTITCRCGRTTSTTICHQGKEEPPQCTRTCKTLMNCGRHECGERCCPGEKLAAERQSAKRRLRPLNNDTIRPTEVEFEAAHICTRTCGRELKCGNPEHTCQELCHRGACGSCREAIFDEIVCNCGRTILQPPLPCGTQPPVCHYQCTRATPCGHPKVSHQCHNEDACPKCPYLVEKQCMCGKKTLKNQPCWTTSASCGEPCGRRLKCGIHSCRKPCHRIGECEDADSKSCPHQCGKKKTASDCGHPCLDQCHAPYPCKEDKPCQAKIIITCACQRRKQEVKCLASKLPDSKTEDRSLVCDDECLRLQRNQKLAAALNIDSNHMDDHIPYSTATLNIFKEDVKWSQTQEREIRIFAADETIKRLRFKPMQPRQRAFLHSLAEDFGLDSESLDPEPHRHVIIYKTPRFVSEPLKTISQCINIKATPQPSAAATLLPPSRPLEDFNAILLTNPKFALTIEELRSDLQSDLSSIPADSIQVSFLPSEEIVIHNAHGTKELDQATLKNLKPSISKTVLSLSLASSVSLCRIDDSLNVVRREDIQSSGGWSQVVKGGSGKPRVKDDNTVGSRSAFTVLGSKGMAARKAAAAKEAESVLDDWEMAAD